MAMLEIGSVTKHYVDDRGQTRQVLRGIDLTAEAGEIVGLLGPNGAGKTTLVSIVAGLRSADGGTVRLHGIDALRDPRQARRHLGIAPQELGVYPTCTVSQNLRFAGEINGLSGRLLHQRVDQIAGELSIDDLLGRRVRELSGGQQRRLHAAMALLHRPAVIFLDEPTVGADVTSRAHLLHAVRRLAEAGAAVVYCTHYLPELEQLDASIAVLHRGVIVHRSTIADLVAAHARTTVDLAFDDGSTRSIVTDDPGATAARALNEMGAERQRVTSLTISRPTLERAYLAAVARSDAASDAEFPARANDHVVA